MLGKIRSTDHDLGQERLIRYRNFLVARHWASEVRRILPMELK
jgi:hypothetical protein